MQDLLGYEAMYNYICDNRDVAMFGVETNMNVLARKVVKRGGKCDITKFSDGVLPVSQTFGFAMNSTYSEFVNYK